jgi:hypothetical protein
MPEHPVQGSLWRAYEAFTHESPNAVVNGGKPSQEELQDILTQEMLAATIYRTPLGPTVAFPRLDSATVLGQAQIQSTKYTSRFAKNSDLIHWQGRLAVSKFIGQPVADILADWKRALRRGNGGVCWEADSLRLGCWATDGGKTTFRRVLNPRVRFNAITFARVDAQRSGAAYVELRGWATWGALEPLIHWERGRRYSVDVEAARSAGALRLVDELKALIGGLDHGR